MTRRAAITPVTRASAAGPTTEQDLVAVEAPLSVTVRREVGSPFEHRLGVFMRTPGDDEELVAGFLHGEGAIGSGSDISGFSIVRADRPAEADSAVVTLDGGVVWSAERFDRGAAATSACGLCGRLEATAIDEGRRCPLGSPAIDAAVITTLPGRLLQGQGVFGETGGLHAAALVEVNGAREVVREDVGRHNAVDKVVGAALFRGWLPGHRFVLVVSGRVAYEIVQKAVTAGLPAVVAIGAPSSLAVDAARRTGLTLIGFVRGSRFNVYSGWDRITGDDWGIPPTGALK